MTAERARTGASVDRWLVVLLAAAILTAAIAVGATVPPSSGCPAPTRSPMPHTPVQHLFLIIKENHAFENYFGDFPGVAGSPPAATLPIAFGSNSTVSPFNLTAASTPELPHDRAASVVDWDGGRNDLFVAEASARGAQTPTDAAGVYGPAQIGPYFQYATSYALGDEFFSGILGPTLPNRLFDLGYTELNWTDDSAPPTSALGGSSLLEQMSARGLAWSYYYSGPRENLTPLLVPAIAANPCLTSRIVPLSDLGAQLNGSEAPAVAYVDPSHDPLYSEHPPENVTLGALWTSAVVNEILQSKVGSSSAILIFDDESGGFWDPLPPPRLSALGDGFRVPFLVISPWTPPGLVVREVLDPASILQFIEENWAFPYSSSRIADASSLQPFFDFAQSPRAPVLLPVPPNLLNETPPAATVS